LAQQLFTILALGQHKIALIAALRSVASHDQFRIIHTGFDMRHFKDLSMAQKKFLTLIIGLLTEVGNGIALFHPAKSGHD
jgi:hypothetical protein